MKDEELQRIAGLVRLVDELENKLFLLRRRCGESAFTRAIQYVKSRKSYELGRWS